MEDWRNDTGSQNPSTRGNICPYVTLSTTNPSQIGVELGHERFLPITFKAIILQI